MKTITDRSKEFTAFLAGRLAFHLTLCLVLALSFSSCSKQEGNVRTSLDLSGSWQFAIDTGKAGITEKWFLKDLPDSIKLPGTMDLNKKGLMNADTTTMHLNRVYSYEGVAWYRKEIPVPENWGNKHVQLIMERTKPSKVWIDEKYIGESSLLESAQVFDLSTFLTPGKHTITLRINNDRKLTPYGNVHIYSDDTQTNWNGIIGDFRLEASDKTYIKNVQIFSDVENKKIRVRISLVNPGHLNNLRIDLKVAKELVDKTTKLKPAEFPVSGDSIVELEYVLGNKMDLWDEYRQPIYSLNVILSKENQVLDNMASQFGMRKFATKGTHFTINGRTTFLRGKHDACVFPLTGHSPMDTAGWMRTFRIAKSYGINHYRFHSWCPPEAAFEAADRMGIYLQPELPFWGGLKDDSILTMLQNEGLAMLKRYGNHPSFVMLSAGNEIWGDQKPVENLIASLKKSDSRPLYTQGSNNNIGYTGPVPGADYHTAARTPYSGDTILTHTRLTQAFCDSRDGGILNTTLPSASLNYDYAVSLVPVPLISHEVGQYQIYPDFKEIEKYTGVLRALNLEVFRKRLERSGMLDQNREFTNASGKWSALCYRDEIEVALRTGGLAGFQLLDLQDFPGQGTALVGILDAFMDSKNVITAEEWREFCNDVVPLLVFDKYCWTNKETFSALVKVAQYGEADMNNTLNWKVTGSDGSIINSGKFDGAKIQQGGLFSIGKIEVPLTAIKTPQKLTISLALENTQYKNTYSVWVYPDGNAIKPDPEITIVSVVDQKVINLLKQGKKVLLFPDAGSVKKNSLAGLFPPDFWNYGMFKGISEWVKKPVSPGTLGILTNPEHPVFASFPTDFYTNWQWFSIIKNSNPLILDKTAKNYRPIIQVIDNMERNHKLGLLFEFKMGEGKLLVCMSDLRRLQNRPEAVQLYSSILSYMQSANFNPGYVVDEEMLHQLFQ
jgi:hypothetical protein